MSRSNLMFASVLAGLVTATGCTVKAPTTPYGHSTGDIDAGDNQQQQQNTPDMAQPAPVTAPQLDTYSQTTVYSTVPLRGTTSPPNSAVIITAMDGTQTSADVDSVGRFCANLYLQANKANVFQLKTHDPASGRESESISIQVNQSGQPPQGQQPAQPYNASAGGAGTAYQIGTSGTAAAQQVTDGDTSTWIEASYSSGWFSGSPQPSVIVRLTEATSIDKIVAVLPSDCPIDGKIELAYSAQSAPAQPGDGAAGWIPVSVSKSSDGMTWSASFNGATATYIAAWWSKDSGGCNGGYISPDGSYSNYTYGLAELQAWTTPGGVVPPQNPPMCGS